MDFLTGGTGAAIGGVASGIGSLIGAGGSLAASNAQVSAANRAIDLTRSMFDTTQNNLLPFIQAGQNALSPYYNLLSGLSLPEALRGFQPTGGVGPPSPTQNTFDLNAYQRATEMAPFTAKPFTTPGGIPTFDYSKNPAPSAITTPTTGLVNPVTTSSTVPTSFDYQHWGLGADQQKALEETPGYQFTLGQGLRAVANQEAAKGRGVSGNELGGAAKYATGLADTTFNQQLQNALSSQGQSFGQTLQGQGQIFGQGLSSAEQLLAAQNQAYNQRAGSYGLGLAGQAQAFNQPLAQQNQAWNQLLQGQGQGYTQGYGNLNQQMALNQLAYNQPLSTFDALLRSGALSLAGQGQGYTQGYQNALAPFGLVSPLIGYGVQSGLGLGNIAANTSNSLAGLTTGAGAATAGGIVGGANALTSGANNIGNYAILNQLLRPKVSQQNDLANF